MKFKGTKGYWTSSKQIGKKGHCSLAQVFCNDNSLLTLDSTETEEESSYNALLISKAPEMFELLIKVSNFLKYQSEIDKTTGCISAYNDCLRVLKSASEF